ncbi:GNAT family N-acetyltransferase [Cellulomonas sp. P22]|uniref:GNAT family N-acetyltransferase n=1 Tax=Cellulomonas sp. P22 TaxID=3373189 RepID=UPI003799EB47
MTTMDDVTVWPFTGLRVVQGDLELRYLSDDLLHELAAVAARGVHAPDRMPFTVPWTRGTPEEVGRSVLTYQWGVRSRTSPERWSIELAVLRDGIPQGVQGLSATDFAVTRDVTTGSWLGLEFQGKGTGTRMRALALHLAFEGFGAQVARTDAFADNPASNAVTRKMGYAPDGIVTLAREGQPAVSQRYRLERADWEQRGAACGLDRSGIELHGVGPVRRFLAID